MHFFVLQGDKGEAGIGFKGDKGEAGVSIKGELGAPGIKGEPVSNSSIHTLPQSFVMLDVIGQSTFFYDLISSCDKKKLLSLSNYKVIRIHLYMIALNNGPKKLSVSWVKGNIINLPIIYRTALAMQ